MARDFHSLCDLLDKNNCEVVGVGMLACRFPGGLSALRDNLSDKVAVDSIHAVMELACEGYLYQSISENDLGLSPDGMQLPPCPLCEKGIEPVIRVSELL